MGSDGSCAARPGVGLGTWFSRGSYGLGLSIDLPAKQGTASYSLPMPLVGPYASASADLYYSEESSGQITWTNLQVVSGTVAVERSSLSELRISFALELELPSTMERFSITGGTATVGDCSVEETRVCVGGD
jgi:hypothetical protein